MVQKVAGRTTKRRSTTEADSFGRELVRFVSRKVFSFFVGFFKGGDIVMCSHCGHRGVTLPNTVCWVCANPHTKYAQYGLIFPFWYDNHGKKNRR